jgi:adenosylcobinamide-GDP ribazoletransferase
VIYKKFNSVSCAALACYAGYRSLQFRFGSLHPMPSFAKHLIWAALFLTRLPMPRVPAPHPALYQTLWAFPVWGFMIGSITGAIMLGLVVLGCAPLLATVLALAAYVRLTGALHHDALADVADGFGGGWDKPRKLDIMADSRLGSYGAIALVAQFAVQAAALQQLSTTLIQHHTLWKIILLWGCAAAIARATPALLMHALPPAKDRGLSHDAGQPIGRHVLQSRGMAAALCLGALLCIWPLGDAAQLWAALWVAGLLMGKYMIRLSRIHIAGHTGDVLGATILLTETITIGVCVLYLAHMP